MDSVIWSKPRVRMSDTMMRCAYGLSEGCKKREHPQMVMDQDGRPVVIVWGLVE